MRLAKFLYFTPLILLLFIALPAQEGQSKDDGVKKALILDGLSKDLPNQVFVEKASSALRGMGYRVDIINDVTVSLYERLPSMGYDVIVLRTHGSLFTYSVQWKLAGQSEEQAEQIAEGGRNGLFTNEPYSTSNYILEQLQGYVTLGKASGKELFVVTPKFIMEKMKGDFRGTTIIMMNCNGFLSTGKQGSSYESLSSYLVKKGAKEVIGWEGLVSIDHVDKTTLQLLDKMRSMPTKDAFEETAKGVGQDAASSGKIRYLAQTN